MDLFCPRCSSQLARDNSIDGGAWTCREGHGRTVGMGPLRRLLDHGIASDLWRQAASAPESRRSCPSCAKIMGAVEAPGEQGVVDIEMCRRCHMAWLDEGEWAQLPKRPRMFGEERAELPEEAVEILAKADASRVARRHRDSHSLSLGEMVAAHLRLPLRDDHKWGLLPITPVTLGLVLAMAVATVLAHVSGISGAVDDYGLLPSEPLRLGGLSIISALLIQPTFIHLIVGGYFIFMFGAPIEMKVGSRRLALVLVSSMFAALAAQMLVAPDTPVVGAVAAVSAFVTLFGLSYPAIPFRMVAAPLGFWVRVPAIAVAAAFVVYGVAGALLSQPVMGLSAALSHLAGAAAGGAYAIVWRDQLRIAERVARVASGSVVVRS